MTFREEEKQTGRDVRKLEDEIEKLEGAERTHGRLLLVIIQQNIFQIKAISDLSAAVTILGAKVDRLLIEVEPSPQLTNIKLKFTTGGIMAEGPVVLSSGQSTVATVDYFDATGAPMPSTFVPPPVTFSIDNAAVASSTPGTDLQSSVIAYVSAGAANLTASVTSAEGLALSDTETVTCSPIVLPPPVLTSVRLNFGTPTP